MSLEMYPTGWGSAVQYGGKIFYFGGWGTDPNDTDHISNNLYILDIADGVWTLGPEAPTPRRYHSAVVYNDNMYVWGGVSDYYSEVVLNTMDIFNFSNYTWTGALTGGQPRFGHCCGVYGTKMYAWGGTDRRFWGNDQRVFTSMDIFDFTTGQWTSGVSGGTGRVFGLGLVLNNQFFTIGGNSLAKYRENLVEIFNFSTSTWSLGPGLITGRSDTAGAVIANRIFVWSGSFDVGIIPSYNEMYDPSIGHWSSILDGGTHREAHVGVGYQNKIYYLGGESSNEEYAVDIFYISEPLTTTPPPPEATPSDLWKKDFAYIPYPMTSFELPLTEIPSVGTRTIKDEVFDRSITITAASDDRTGLPYTAYMTGAGQGFVILDLNTVDGGNVDTFITGPNFIFDVDLFIDSHVTYTTLSVSLFSFSTSEQPPQPFMPSMETWFFARFSRVGKFWVFHSEASQINWGSFCAKFALNLSAIPIDSWFKLTLTRNKDTNAYTWYLNDEVLLDRRSRYCGWESDVYWDTDSFFTGSQSYGVESSLLSCNNGKVYYKNIKIQKGTSLPTKVSPLYISDCAGAMSTAPVEEYDWITGFYYLANAFTRYEDTSIPCESESGSPGFLTTEQFFRELCVTYRCASTVVTELIPGTSEYGDVHWEYGWSPSLVYCGGSMGYLPQQDGGMCLGVSSYALTEDGGGYEFKEVKIIVHPDLSLGRDPMRMSQGYRVELFMKFPQVQFTSTILSGYAVEDTEDNIVPWEITLAYYNGNEVGGSYGRITVEGMPFDMGPDFIFPPEGYVTGFRFEREKASSIIRIYIKPSNEDWKILRDVNGDLCEYQYSRTLFETDSPNREYYIMSFRESENSWGIISQYGESYFYRFPVHRLFFSNFRISHYLSIDE
jgi:hypothetical protein